jgi:hypothetical protein
MHQTRSLSIRVSNFPFFGAAIRTGLFVFKVEDSAASPSLNQPSGNYSVPSTVRN